MNEIFIVMDDSGKLNKNENSCIYGGLFFFSNTEYINFINKYKSIINNIKCKYCKKTCDKNCIEIKGITKLSKSDNRRIFNLLKKQNNYGIFINNNKIYDSIMCNKSARGRYNDYAQKRIIKEIVLFGINNKKIDKNKPLKLNIKIDECKTKSNGYYNLRNSIYEELVNGIINFDYSTFHEPTLNSNLELILGNYNFKYNYGIQSADLIAHYLHSEYEKHITCNKDISNILNNIEVKLFLP